MENSEKKPTPWEKISSLSKNLDDHFDTCTESLAENVLIEEYFVLQNIDEDSEMSTGKDVFKEFESNGFVS